MRPYARRMEHSTPTFGFVIEPVENTETAKRFYTEVMGLKVQREHPVYVQFDHFAIASDGAKTTSLEPEIYWLVDDVERAFAEVSRKAEITHPLKEEGFGKFFGVKDPVGRTQFVLQLAANRPSQPAGD